MLSFGKRLKQEREKRGLSLRDFAEKIGVSFNAVRFFEEELRTPSLAVAIRICKELDVSMDYLFLGKEE